MAVHYSCDACGTRIESSWGKPAQVFRYRVLASRVTETSGSLRCDGSTEVELCEPCTAPLVRMDDSMLAREQVGAFLVAVAARKLEAGLPPGAMVKTWAESK